MSDEIQVSVPRSHFRVGQFQHVLLLAALLPGACWIAEPVLGDGAFLGWSDRAWFRLALGVPVFHQVIVALGWRSQLCCRALTKVFGERDLFVWGLIFLPLLVVRPLALAGLAAADAGSLGWPTPLPVVLGVLLLLPGVYTFRSVHKVFGIPRALGGDHFRERYRRMPFVREGAFLWSSNAMYTFGFLALWSIALFGDSRAALAVALFQHAYIWVHWYCTEEPDIRLLYGSDAEAE
jgi:hypothetical protein